MIILEPRIKIFIPLFHFLFVYFLLFIHSGMELGEEILSVEQFSTFKSNQKKRQSLSAQSNTEMSRAKAVPVVSSKKYAKAVVQKKEFIPPMPKCVEPLVPEPLFSDTDTPEDPDMPALEFLDMEEELQSFVPELDNRSPFIPGPFSDYDLKSRDINSLLADIDESELIDRAPYIPPPCIDKIASFDDLSLPDLTDNYQDALDDSPNPVMGNTAAFIDSADVRGGDFGSPDQMYDFGNAKVPAHLLKKFMPMIGKY